MYSSGSRSGGGNGCLVVGDLDLSRVLGSAAAFGLRGMIASCCSSLKLRGDR